MANQWDCEIVSEAKKRGSLRIECLHIAENQNKSINFVYGDSRLYS